RHAENRNTDPPHPPALRQQAADDEPERESRRSRRRVDRDRAVPDRALGEARRDDRETGRGGERRADALDEPGCDEERAVVDEAAERGRDDEHAEGDQEHLPPSEQVRSASAEDEGAAVTEDVT